MKDLFARALVFILLLSALSVCQLVSPVDAKADHPASLVEIITPPSRIKPSETAIEIESHTGFVPKHENTNSEDISVGILSEDQLDQNNLIVKSLSREEQQVRKSRRKIRRRKSGGRKRRRSGKTDDEGVKRKSCPTRTEYATKTTAEDIFGDSVDVYPVIHMGKVAFDQVFHETFCDVERCNCGGVNDNKYLSFCQTTHSYSYARVVKHGEIGWSYIKLRSGCHCIIQRRTA